MSMYLFSVPLRANLFKSSLLMTLEQNMHSTSHGYFSSTSVLRCASQHSVQAHCSTTCLPLHVVGDLTEEETSDSQIRQILDAILSIRRLMGEVARLDLKMEQ